jgi:predicted RNA binding protein YcfA (HicA-like mRNA interferase family)/predicted RNase H-like HicB family nuclease
MLLAMKKRHFHFNIFLRPEPEGGFTAIVPALPGCVTYGRTLGEAKKMAKDAIRGYIESLKSTRSRSRPTTKRWSPPWISNMPKLPAVRPREVIRFLEQNGFVLDHATGSHFIFYNPTSKKRAVVSHHNRDIPKGTLLSLLREAGFSRVEFLNFLEGE